MRDITTGHIEAGRDVIFNDQSNQPKLLIQCTNEELIQEEKHRRDLLDKERKKRGSFFAKIFIISGLLIVFAMIWAHFQGNTNLVTLLSGGMGIIMALANIKAMDARSVFEERQIAALEEIHMILRERGVR